MNRRISRRYGPWSPPWQCSSCWCLPAWEWSSSKIVHNGQETTVEAPQGSTVHVDANQGKISLTLPIEENSEMASLMRRTREAIEMKQWLRAYVAMWRIEGQFRDTSAHMQRPKEIDELKRQIAEHIDVRAVEYHEGYVLNHRPNMTEAWSTTNSPNRDSQRIPLTTKQHDMKQVEEENSEGFGINAPARRDPSDADSWADMVRLLEQRAACKKGLLAMRVFLEEPASNDVIQSKGNQNCQTMAIRSMAGGRYKQTANGDPVLFQPTCVNRCSLCIESLRHGSAQIETTIQAEKVAVLGDIVLLRPNGKTLSRLELLRDDPPKMTSNAAVPQAGNDFLLGRLTAGGKFGVRVSLRAGEMIDAGQFSPRQDLDRLDCQPAQALASRSARRKGRREYGSAIDSSGGLAEPEITPGGNTSGSGSGVGGMGGGFFYSGLHCQ